MARTLATERAAQTAATLATAPGAAGLSVAEQPVADPPVADPPRRNRLPTAHYKPESVLKRKVRRKARGKTEDGIVKMTYPSGAGALYNFYSFSLTKFTSGTAARTDPHTVPPYSPCS